MHRVHLGIVDTWSTVKAAVDESDMKDWSIRVDRLYSN